MKIKVTSVWALLFCSSSLWAATFGWHGQNGRSGAWGKNGRDGQSISVQATGASASYDLSGQDGGNGYPGEPGYGATSCRQPLNATSNQRGADGGDGGSGGQGGRGGDGGSLTIYFEDLSHLRSVFVRGTPGDGGYGAWGARGGEGCRCQVSSWTPPGSTTTYYCEDGQHGRNGYSGSHGARGSYGAVTLISQLEPLAAEKSSAEVDMGEMETTSVSLSKNLWERRSGARKLFAPGSDIADSYLIFTGRVEASYSFRWEVERPVSDFSKWKMVVRLEGKEPKLYLPSGIWVDGKLEANGTHYTYVFRSVVSTKELGNLQLASFSGVGLDHGISVVDKAGVSNLLQSSFHLQYYAYENGSYRVKFDKPVPAEALSGDAKGFRIAMGKLGIEEKYLAAGTKAYVRIVVTRALGSQSVKYQMSSYYTIKYAIAVGNKVEVLLDSNLLSGSTVVGKVKKGEIYLVDKIQGEWVSLKKEDGTAVSGWIQDTKLKPL